MKLGKSFPVKVVHNGTFGGYLRFCRLLQGFTIEETGKIIGRDKVSMSLMERDRYCPPGVDGLAKLADFLKMKYSTKERWDFIVFGLAERMNRKGLTLNKMLEKDMRERARTI